MKPLGRSIDRRSLLAHAGAVLVAAGLDRRIASAADASPGPVRRDAPVGLRCWLMGHEAEFLGQMLPEFERRNPGITVSIQQLPWTAAHEKLLTAFAGDAVNVTPNRGLNSL